MLTRDEWKNRGFKADMDGHAVVDGVLHIYDPETGNLYPLEAPIAMADAMFARLEGDDVVVPRKRKKKHE